MKRSARLFVAIAGLLPIFALVAPAYADEAPAAEVSFEWVKSGEITTANPLTHPCITHIYYSVGYATLGGPSPLSLYTGRAYANVSCDFGSLPSTYNVTNIYVQTEALSAPAPGFAPTTQNSNHCKSGLVPPEGAALSCTTGWTGAVVETAVPNGPCFYFAAQGQGAMIRTFPGLSDEGEDDIGGKICV